MCVYIYIIVLNCLKAVLWGSNIICCLGEIAFEVKMIGNNWAEFGKPLVLVCVGFPGRCKSKTNTYTFYTRLTKLNINLQIVCYIARVMIHFFYRSFLKNQWFQLVSTHFIWENHAISPELSHWWFPQFLSSEVMAWGARSIITRCSCAKKYGIPWRSNPLVGGAMCPSWNMMEFVNGVGMTSHIWHGK